MDYILPFIVGFLAAFVGLIPPAMLNMTAARTSIEKGIKEGFLFAVGATSIVFVQGFIAVYFANVITNKIIEKLKIAAVFVLFGLAIFFFIQARKKFNIKGKDKKGNSFLIGLGMSSLNMMAIPFYLGMAKLFKNGVKIPFIEIVLKIRLYPPFSYIYVFGAVIGAFLLFSLYVYFAQIIAKKATFIAQNINYILSALFIVLGIVLLFQVVKIILPI